MAASPRSARAQAREGFEAYVGPGFFSSPSDRQPSLRTIEIGATYWFGQRWGVSVVFGFGTSDEVGEAIDPDAARERVARGKLRLRQFMVERRVTISDRWDVLLGGGFLGALHTNTDEVRDTVPPTEVSNERGFGYINFEALARWRMRDRFGLRAGVHVSGPLVVRGVVLASFELG